MSHGFKIIVSLEKATKEMPITFRLFLNFLYVETIEDSRISYLFLFCSLSLSCSFFQIVLNLF